MQTTSQYIQAPRSKVNMTLVGGQLTSLPLHDDEAQVELTPLLQYSISR